MGPIWGRQDPGGPHVGPMNFAIWEHLQMAYLNAFPYKENVGILIQISLHLYPQVPVDKMASLFQLVIEHYLEKMLENIQDFGMISQKYFPHYWHLVR